ncbi:hypothetical protein D477_010186, partial [Arthrobacter crystallopoietes BAB-32]
AGAVHAAGAAPASPDSALSLDEQITRLVTDPHSSTRRALLELLDTQTIPAGSNAAPALAANGRTDPRKAGSDVVLLLGQSNMQGAGTPYDPGLDIRMDGIDQFAGSGPHAGKVLPAEDPLHHVTTYLFNGAASVGPGMEFARQFWLRQPADRRVLLVPAARGGTSFAGGADYSWDPDNTTARVNLAHRAISECKTALALNPNHRLAAILWHQGESDALPGKSARWYRNKLLQLIDLLRAEFGQVPFLVGGMVPEWVAWDRKLRGPFDAVHRAIPKDRPLTAFVEGPAGAGLPGDIIHYSAAGARELGLRYYQAFAALGTVS